VFPIKKPIYNKRLTVVDSISKKEIKIHYWATHTTWDDNTSGIVYGFSEGPWSTSFNTKEEQLERIAKHL
jgi:hypothetical protein